MSERATAAAAAANQPPALYYNNLYVSMLVHFETIGGEHDDDNIDDR